MARGGNKCSKVFMHLFNIIFLLVGFFMLGAGIYIRVKGIFLGGFVFGVNVSIGLMVLGGIVILFSLFGIVSVLSGSRCLIYTYAVLVLLTIVGELIVGSFAFVERAKECQ